MVGDIISLGVFDSEDEWTQQKLQNSMVGFVRLPMIRLLALHSLNFMDSVWLHCGFVF